MNIYKSVLFLAVSLAMFFMLLGCAFEHNTSAPSVSGELSVPVIGQPLPWSASVTKALGKLVAANNGKEIALDLSNDDEYQYILQRCGLSGKSRSNSPQLFEELARTREIHLARKTKGDGTRDIIPVYEGPSIVEFVKDKAQVVLAAVEGVASQTAAEETELSEYMFIDVVAFDPNMRAYTEYKVSEGHNISTIRCSAKGANYALTRADSDIISTDTIMCYKTRDIDGDGTNDILPTERPVMKVAYSVRTMGTNGMVYPNNFLLYHPVENWAGATDLNTSVCTICLKRTADDCDYDFDEIGRLYPDFKYTQGDIILPFKGEISYTGYRIIPDPNNATKPHPGLLDSANENYRKIEVTLSLDEAGKKASMSDEFFWNHPNTVISWDTATNTSKLSWNLWYNFGNKVYYNTDIVKFFVNIDVPVREAPPAPMRARACIIPENYYNGSPFEYNPFLTKMELAPGSHSLAIYGISKNGLVSQTASNAITYNWTIDTTPPTAEIYNTPLSLTSNKKAQIAVGGANVVAYSYKLDAVINGEIKRDDWRPAIDINTPISIDVSAQNFETLLYSLKVVGIDRAGNKQAEKADYDCTWLIQPNSNPEAFLSGLPAYVTNSRSSTITVTGNANVIRYDYQLDSNAKVTGCPIAQAINLSNLGEGLHTLKVWAATANATQASSTNYSWNIDITPPVLSVNDLYMAKTADNKTNSTEFYAEVGGSDIAKYEYKIDSGASVTQSISTPITAQNLTNGIHTLSVYGFDRAGNKQASPTTYQWTVDPSLNLIVIRNLAKAFTTSTTLNLKLEGANIISYKYRLDADADWSFAIPLVDLMVMPKMNFRWSCIAAGTEIKMADGTTKKIETIKEGELVKSENDKTFPVCIVTTGREEIMYRITDEFNHSVLLTQGHPLVMADNSKKLARYVKAGDKISTENGQARVVSVITEKYDGAIYNLTLGTKEELTNKKNEGRAMYANGILVGDKEMQATQMSLANKPKGDLLSNIPVYWRYDYRHSPILNKNN